MGNDTFRISQNFGAGALNPVADQSSMDFYSVPPKVAPSATVKDDFVTPSDLPNRQGSIYSQTISANTNSDRASNLQAKINLLK